MKRQEYAAMAQVEKHHWWYQHLRSLVLEKITHYSTTKSGTLDLFDAGCGTGGMLQAIQESRKTSSSRINLHGCEPSPWAYNSCLEKQLPVRQCRIEDYQSKAKYDIILCLDVLYHANVKPDAAIKVLSNLLKPDGLLIINTAAMPCLSRQHDVNVMGARRFLPEPLRKLCQNNALLVSELHYWNSWLVPILWISIQTKRAGHLFHKKSLKDQRSDLRLPPEWINNVLKAILKVEARVSPFVKPLFGTSIFLTARKL